MVSLGIGKDNVIKKGYWGVW